MFGHLLFFKENNIFDLIEMFKMRSANTPQLAKSCSSTFEKQVLWSDEKYYVLNQGPNRSIDR